MHATLPLLRSRDFPAIARKRLETLQVNVGYKCNQTCVHCHVNAGPTRTEEMPREVADTVLAFLRGSDVKTLDITGGAPELNPHFRYLVVEARKLGVKVIDRCNLTILNEPGQEDLAEFLAAPSRRGGGLAARATSRTTSTGSAARACSPAASSRCRS